MSQTRKIIIIIPARSGSKRLPQKNILIIKNKPLFFYSVKAAIESNLTKHVYVLSDNPQILKKAEDFGAIPFELTPELASDTAEVVRPSIYAIEKLKENGLEFDDFICLQPTSPLRTSEDIKKSYEAYILKDANFLVSVSEVDPHYFHWAIKENTASDYSQMYFGEEFFKSRAELPKIYWPNGAIKIAKIDSIKNRGHFFGEKMAIYKMPADRSVHIATKNDFEICKNQIEHEL